MSPSPIDPDVANLLSTAVESADALEILLALRREQPRTFTARALRTVLGMPTASIDRHLAGLCGHGFLAVTIRNDLIYTYRPMSAEMDRLAGELESLWATRRLDVEALLRPPR
jgi:DNA-binding IclR family transcriptional regulator